MKAPLYPYGKEATLWPVVSYYFKTVMECGGGGGGLGWGDSLWFFNILQRNLMSTHTRTSEGMVTLVLRCWEASCQKRCFISLEYCSRFPLKIVLSVNIHHTSKQIFQWAYNGIMWYHWQATKLGIRAQFTSNVSNRSDNYSIPQMTSQNVGIIDIKSVILSKIWILQQRIFLLLGQILFST